MNPRVVEVTPEPDYYLRLVFTNGEVRRFDVNPYLGRGVFNELKDPAAFKKVESVLGSVQWKSGQDFCPDTLYEDSRPV